VRSFCERIDLLDYPERPRRKLWIHGDTPRVDHQLPRAIPDQDWQRLNDAQQRLTSEEATKHRFPPPFERTQAVFAVLFESGLRAGELCRLDTGCLLAASDPQTGEQTHWLRVPVGKLHNDRMIPVRVQVVAAIDAWMKVRGQQPAMLDERTNKMTDYLFAWRGQAFAGSLLNVCISKLCELAGTERRYTSHWFRHTLATLWRRRGMRIETISRMLGHKDLKMTMRYAAVMPSLLRQEFETAFAQIDEEHRATAQVRVLLSPEAHIAAQVEWRESLFVDLGLGWCGLTAYHPCETRLACQSCPNLIPDKESLPLLERQRANLIELRGLASEKLPSMRREEINRELAAAIEGIERNIAVLSEKEKRQARSVK
jgi:site-specific recombinase XerD